jgi:transcriptional regulator with XRE-family HTH domain/tetratricopeptide (TPR) repeat protein
MAEAFADLLRKHRLRRRFTQEALAERAGISSRSVREMERGRGRGPRPRTVELLAAALELDGDERGEFVEAGGSLFWASRVGRPEPGRPRQLPADLADFVGRDREIAVLREVLDGSGPRLAAISGPPGIGKTALAVHAAHLLADRFPDGQLYAALRGGTTEPADPGEVLAHLLRALGIHGSALPRGLDARAALFRERLAGRRVLVVLDDAAGHRQVEPLLPAGAAAAVTSRRPLTGLPGVIALDLRPLSGPAGVELLDRVAGGERVRAEPAAAADLVAACGGLPLAVRITGARLAARPQWTIAGLAGRFADERRRLDELRHGDLAVRTGLQLTYRGLSPAAGRAFALLGELGIPSFPQWPVAALLGVDPAAGAAALDELIDARLLDELGADQAGQLRFRLHDVTRLYARERREAEIEPADWVAALDRVAAGWLALARQAQDGLDCERLHLDDRANPATTIDQYTVDRQATAVATDHPVAWFEAEREALAVLVPACAEADLVASARGLAGCAADFYALRGYFDDWYRVTQPALAACRKTDDRLGEAAMLRSLGTSMIDLRMPDEAIAALRTARRLAEAVGDRAGAAMAGKDIGFLLGLAGRLDEAAAELRTSADELDRVGRHTTRALALGSLGFTLRERGETSEAERMTRAALALARSCRHRFTEAYTSRQLAGVLLARGRHREAARIARRAVALFQRIGDPIGRAQSLRALGEALTREPGRSAEAEENFTAAAALFRHRGYPWGLALTELSLGEMEVRRGLPGAADRLRRVLRYWVDEQVPGLQARTLVALAAAAEQAGDATAHELRLEAYEIYRELKAPEAAELATRLELPG